MSATISHFVKAVSILEDCCARAAQCRLHLLHSGQFADANFHESNRSRLVFHVTHCEREDELQPAALCCVAFPFQTSMYAFLDCIKNVRDGATALEVHFAIPEFLTATNLRQTFRVPVVRSAEVRSEMRLPDGTRITADALNVSEAGIEIDLGKDDRRVAVDTEVQFSIKFRDETIEIPAIVRRCRNSRRALKFTPLQTNESRQVTVVLQRIVRSLEQLWLKNRTA